MTSRWRLFILLSFIGITLFFYCKESPGLRSQLLRHQAGPITGPGRPKYDAMEEFVSSFPTLRDGDARGFPGRRGDRPEKPSTREERDLKSKGWGDFDWPTTRSMFVFGDSYFIRVLMNIAATMDADYRKNGVDNGLHDEMLCKPADMRWTNYLYATYHDHHYLRYWNFAKPGAVIDEAVVTAGRDDFGSFITQIDDFEDLFTPMPGPNLVNWHSEDSLFIVLFGMNDIGRIDRSGKANPDLVNITMRMAASQLRSIHRLYTLGARNFLVLGAPNISVAPKYVNPNGVGHNIQGLIARAVPLFNGYLRESIDEFERDHHDASMMFFNLAAYVQIVRDNPELFGFTDTARYQFHLGIHHKNNGKAGLFWQDYHGHPTWSFAQMLARAVSGFLMRHSKSLQYNNATEIDLIA